MTYEEFKTNFLPEFLNIKSFAGKIKFAKEHLTQIGSGTGRVVYDIDGEKVLKLAKNPKGIAQNEAEANAGRYPDTHSIVTEVFEESDDSEWLISEKAKKVNEARIKQLTGIPSLNDLYYYLRNFHDQNNGKRAMFGQDREMVELLNENEFVQELQNFIANYSQSPGDFGRPSTYGEVLRDGQPSIVLTDYGLNDEVYDTHYSGKLKQRGYRMYEMYNFADGNDDILSDMPPQDGVDTRQGMWGLMPYGVGDGPGVINEEFISFVENRDKYPTGVLPSTPYMLDEFHDIVNNLREVLDHVQDKKKFYNNLLELQDYLIRGKFYDREPLGKEMLSESPLAISKIPDEQSDKIASELSAKLNLGTPQPLGPGGGNGKAYLINGNKILKITVDPCEVFAGAKTNAAHPKTLVFTHKIYKAIDTETDVEVYALINDYIADKPYDDFERYKTLISSLDTTNENALYEKLLDFLMKGKTKAPEFFGMTLDDFPELAKLILTNKPEANISQEDRQKAYQYMMGLYEIRRELLSLGIKSRDFMVSSNLGYKDGVLIYFDIGECQVPDLNIPPDAIIRLPEGKEMLDEEVLGVPREIADRVANSVSQKFNYGKPQYVGEGVFGYAYDIGNNMILKVTKDHSEANENLELIGKPLKYIAQPYKVFSIKSDSIFKSIDKELYVIILEKLKTDTARFKAANDRINFAFNKIMGVKLTDVFDYYIHGFADGVDEEKIKKYMSRNPEDAWYFNSLLKIYEEAKKYGVESMDYVNPSNLGYKPDGSIGFFDVGFGNYFFKSSNKPEPVQVDEDASALYSTDNSFGQDNFPVHNNDDTSPMIQNDLNANSAIDEDLEYNHVVGDATQDEFQITERVKSSMPGSSTVEVKQKCRLAGNGNTSTACNQGDINNLNIKPLRESVSLNLPSGDIDKSFGTYEIMNDGQIVGELELMNRDNNYLVLDRIFIEKEFRGEGYANDAIQLLFKYADENNKIITLTPDSVWGANKSKLKAWYKSLGFVENKGRNKDFQTMQLMYRLPKSGLNEEIDPKDLRGDDTDSIALKTVINGKRDVCFIELNPTNAKLVQKNSLGVFPVRMTSQNTMMAIVYRDRLKALKLYKIAKEREGYLKDRTPEEAREIGQLLGYKEASIEEYIRRNQHRYGRQIPRAPEPEDFNNMDEDIEGASEKYYRAIEKYMGETIEFEPEGFYEAIDDNGDPIWKYDTFWVSETPEVAASKSVGGALMGLYSMFMQHRKNPGVFYIYEITEKPDVDISHWEIGDFTYLQEVRYRRPVRGSYVGKVDITDDFKKRMNAFYEINSLEAYDEPDEETSEIFQDTDYDQYLNKMKDTVHESENLSTFTDMNEAELMSLQDLPFKQEVEQLGGKIYSVGGAVRDEFLGKQSKDLDVLISGVPFEELEQILGKYGRVDAVGKSFGVLKFKPKGATEDIDIAIPRTETATGEGGHQGFDVKSDHALPIEKDLERRDFTINAIAKDSEGNIVDPFNGQEDLQNKIIRVVNPQAFSDDPLRMLRAVQFASRFGFNIEPETMRMIKDNAQRVKEIAPERILTEFDKIVKKGDKFRGAFLLKDTGLLKEIFGSDAGLRMGQNIWENAKTMGEFVWLLSHNLVQSPAEFYKTNLKGDIDTYKEIKALEFAFTHENTTNRVTARSIAHNMYVTSSQSLQSDILPPAIKLAAQELLSGKYPKTVGELAVNGNDLMQLGLVGKEIGDAQKTLLLNVYSDSVRNSREELLNLDSRNKGMIKEEKSEKVEYGTLLLFLNIPIWERITSLIFPDDIYDKPEYGIETEPHVTVLYGFTDEVTAEEVFGIVRETIPMQPIKVGLKGFSIFRNPNFDVVKFDVNSPELTTLHDAVKQLPNKESFPNYHPHITIAYVKPGTGEKYVKAFEKEKTITGTELIFSTKGHRGKDGETLALSEGTADKAAERMFNIPNQSAQQDIQAAGAVQAQEEQPVAYASGADRKKTAIYENPSSLQNFGPNVRAIIDHEGNVFVAQKDGNFNHGRMGLALGFMESDSDAMYKHLTEYMLVNRIENSNAFGLADSSADFAEDEYDYENLKIVTDFLRAAKRKNPQYEFYPEYFEHVMGKPVTLNEFSYPRMHPDEPNPTWDINGQQVDVNFFADKYYEWNQGGYDTASTKSVQEFLENNYEDFSHDERLKHDLYHKLVDNEVLDEEVKKNVKYTAVVLDNKSRSALLARLGNMIPEGWETIAHHMTMNTGPIAPEYVKFLGMTIVMEAIEFCMDDKVMAVGVEVDKYLTKNAKPHVTIAVNRAEGGKPMMSNQLCEWQKLSEPLILTGKVTEVE